MLGRLATLVISGNSPLEKFSVRFRAPLPDIGEGMSDEELLHAYRIRGSETAFAELVRRHVAAVHAAALRQTGNSHLAEEVTHAVFLQLARKAASLRPNVVLLGWLLRAARYAAIDAVRSETRRQRREAEFLAMHNLETDSGEHDSETLWSRVAPLLDEALLKLRAVDRDALLLRFFQNKSLTAVGAALGIPEDAARKRVQRALERLHSQLQKNGVTTVAATLPGLLSTRAVPVCDAHLAHSATQTALSTPATSTVPVSGLAAGVGRRMFMAGLRPWVVGASVLLAGASGTALVSRQWAEPHQTLATIDDDYTIAGFPDARVVRDFVADLQQHVRRGEARQVAGLTQFPIRINSTSGSEYIPDADTLVARYEDLFRSDVVGVILKSPNRRLYCDHRGVMIGDGTLWIAAEGESTRPTPRIIAVNLPY